MLSAFCFLSLQTIPRAFAIIRRTNSPLVYNMANETVYQVNHEGETMSELFVCVVKVQALALVILLYWEKESVCRNPNAT